MLNLVRCSNEGAYMLYPIDELTSVLLLYNDLLLKKEFLFFVAFKIPFVFSFWPFYYHVSQWIPLWVLSVWGPMNFRYLDVLSLPIFGKFLALISLNELFVPFSLSYGSGISVLWILFLLMVSHNHVAVHYFSSFFFLFSQLTG